MECSLGQPEWTDRLSLSHATTGRRGLGGGQSGMNYDERKSVGVVLEDNDNDETDIRMKVVNNDMNKEGESVKMVEKTISFIKYNTI